MWRIMQKKGGRRRKGVNEEGVASEDFLSLMECQDAGFLALGG